MGEGGKTFKNLNLCSGDIDRKINSQELITLEYLMFIIAKMRRVTNVIQICIFCMCDCIIIHHKPLVMQISKLF